MFVTKHGPPEVLEVRDCPSPEPGPGQVAIDVRAAGVNFADIMARMGLYPEAPKPPCVVGYEVAGVVSEVGPEVEGLAVGDRVVAGIRFGGYSEEVVAAVADVYPLPDRLDFAAGAAIPVNYVTAWAALGRYGAVRPGERVLVHSAAGGVGTAATQIAKSLGAEVFGTASESKLDAIAANGVDHPIDYRRRGWHRGLPTMDVVMDPLGGSSLRRSFGMLRAGGRLVACGVSSFSGAEGRSVWRAVKGVIETPWFSALKQMSESKSVIGLNMLRLWDEFGSLAPLVGEVGDLIESGALEPIVAASFPFCRASSAHRFIQERRNIGKVVLVPG